MENTAYQPDGTEPRVNGSAKPSTDLPPPVVHSEATIPVKKDAPTAESNGVTGTDHHVVVTNGMAFSEATGPDVHHAKKAKRERTPLLYCKLITKYPKSAFGITLSGHIFFILISFGLIRSGYDLIPFQLDRLPLDIKSDLDFLRQEAWNNAPEDKSIITQGSQATTNTSQRTDFGDSVVLYYRIKGGNVFTKENLKLIEDVEKKFYEESDYQKDFCHLSADGNCTKIRSILRFFDGSYGAAFTDPNYDNIPSILNAANSSKLTRQALQFHLGKDASIDATTARSSITRSVLYFGLPLAGYNNATDRSKEQDDKLNRFMLRSFLPKAESLYDSKVGGMDFFYYSGSALGAYITGQVFKDLALAGGSLLFIILFMWVQTGSFWITGWAIFSVITGFLCTNLIYRCIIDYRYFGVFHVLAVFIILGIGADDIFVFFDTWKGTGHEQYPSLAHRMSDCYRKASVAMLFTSVTTAVAFIVSATSPFLGVSAFGVFAGLLVCVNYLSVIVFFPTVVIVHHLSWENCRCCPCGRNASVSNINEGNHDTEDVHKRKHPVVRFFRGPYYRLITHSVARWVIVGVFVVLLAVFIYFATQMKVNEEQVKFLPDNSNFGQVLNVGANAFAANEESSTKVYISWGLKNQDLSSCHFSDPICKGKTVWDDTFNMNSAETQQAVIALCRKLQSLSAGDIDKLRIRRGLFDGRPQVDCFLQGMDDFLTLESNKTKYPSGTNFSLPISAGAVNTLMTGNPHMYNTSLLPSGFNRYFEIAASYWLFVHGESTRKYGLFVGEAAESYTVTSLIGPTEIPYKYGTRLRYAAIAVNITLSGSSTGYPEGLPIRNAWEDFISAEMKKMPVPLRGGFQCTTSLWHWLKVQQTLVSSALIGIGVGIGVALPILIIATMNVVTGVLATFIICCITASVIGVIPLAGWKLGVLESLNLVLVVGLAVDYVVHLAEGYSRSAHTDRKGRLLDTLEEVGISVLSGAVTTLGASFFLLLAQIIFFSQFGIFMFSTIGFSILYALGFFTTLLGIIGPENNFGSIKVLCKPCIKE